MKQNRNNNKKLFERKMVNYHKKRKNERKEKEWRTFPFEKNWFYLEQKRHTLLLLSINANQNTAVVLLQSHCDNTGLCYL